MNAAAEAGAGSAARALQRLQGTQPDRDPANWRLGTGLSEADNARLRSRFPADPAPAAVLVGLVEHAEAPSLLLTVRASDLRHHAGQIAFPGGRIEQGDSGPAQAALREAREEIGLDPGFVQVVGYLANQLIFSGFVVTPVVARIRPGFVLHYDPGEVQGTFEMPWDHLMDERNHRVYPREFLGIEAFARDILFGPHRIWGATAAILLRLRELALAP